MLPMNVPVLVVDGVVKLPPEANGAVVVGGSNATAYAAYYLGQSVAFALLYIMTAASVEMRRGSVVCLGRTNMGMAMAAVAADSARVGDAADMLKRGIISRANKLAATCGVEKGQTVAQAVELLKSAPWPQRRRGGAGRGTRLC